MSVPQKWNSQVTSCYSSKPYTTEHVTACYSRHVILKRHHPQWHDYTELQMDIDTTADWVSDNHLINFDSSWVYDSINVKYILLSPKKALSSSSHGLAQLYTACSRFLYLGTCIGLPITNDLSWSSNALFGYAPKHCLVITTGDSYTPFAHNFILYTLLQLCPPKIYMPSCTWRIPDHSGVQVQNINIIEKVQKCALVKKKKKYMLQEVGCCIRICMAMHAYCMHCKNKMVVLTMD